MSFATLNKFMGYLKIPLIYHRSYKQYLEEIGDEEASAIKAKRNSVSMLDEEES